MEQFADEVGIVGLHLFVAAFTVQFYRVHYTRTACTRTVRLAIETLNSQLTAMGIAYLHVRSIAGLEIKVQASLRALAHLNVN